MTTTTTDIFQTLIAKTKAKRNGDNWQGKCPAHKDETASLSLSCASDGKILLNCFAGCAKENILSVLGFSFQDLFPERPETKPKRTIIAAYDYKDARGNLLFQCIRYDPKGFSQRQPDPENKGRWIYNLKGVTRVLYRLPELLAADPARTVFVCEGEKDADLLWSKGLVATTSPMGANKWVTSFNSDLSGREVVILPDNDMPGFEHAEAVATSLQGTTSVIKIIKLPGLPDKGDVSDWFKAGNDEQMLCELADRAPAWKLPETRPAQQKTKETQFIESGSKRNFVVDMVREHTTLFHDTDGRCFASVNVNGHVETYPVASHLFRIWLSGTYYRRTAAAIQSDTEKDVLRTIEAIARYEGEEHNTFLRLATHGDNIYLDLSDKDWRIVEISANGWRTIEATDAPVKFIRRQAMLPLPEPILGGKMDELRNYLNCEDEDTWALMSSWLVMTLHPSGPYPILSVTGEQGSAKTSACKMLRSIVDPNRADLRALPKDERDMMIACSNSWIQAFDNLSGLTQEWSDVLCRVATGASFTTRALHTDSDESVFTVKRPIMTNGIIDSTGYPDLLERSASIFLRSIPDDKRRDERELWKGFIEAKPRILGATLTAASVALANWQSVKLPRLPRMADFGIWAVAAEKGIGLPEGSFLAAYNSNRSSSNEMALDTPLANYLRQFMDHLVSGHWVGTATDLFRALNTFVNGKGEVASSIYGWPKQPNALGGKLRRIAPNLRAVGLEINCGRTNGGSQIEISRRELSPRAN